MNFEIKMTDYLTEFSVGDILRIVFSNVKSQHTVKVNSSNLRVDYFIQKTREKYTIFSGVLVHPRNNHEYI